MSGYTKLVDLPEYQYTENAACRECLKPVGRRTAICEECLHDKKVFPVNFKRKPKKKEEEEEEYPEY